MIYDISTIVWREMVVLRRRLKGFLFTRMVSPFLYLLTFGLGLGKSVQIAGSGNYLDFIISGIIAMNSMMVCFNTVSSPICMSRILYMTFDEYQTAPISNLSYILGHAVASSIRGVISSFIIVVIAYLFGCVININAYFIFILLVNCFIFSFIGIIAAMFANSHESLNTFTTYVITPMSFLCGVFFRLDNYPGIIAKVIAFLPLTPASSSLRAIGSGGQASFLDITLMLVYLFLTAFLAKKSVDYVRTK